MSEDTWEVPDEYWLVDTPGSRFQISSSQHAKLLKAQDDRLMYIDLVDVTEAKLRLTIRDVHAIYPSTPAIRRRSIMLSEAFNIAEKETRKEYRESRNIFDSE